MNCLQCTSKECKKTGRDCNNSHDQVVDEYRTESVRELYKNADDLVAGGKAGTLSRLEEIILFARSQRYRNIAIAYCFSMETWAKQVADILKARDFTVSSVRCTINGIRENEIVPELKESVNCNPVGQAQELNRSKADLVIEMGLCLGHDILFHQHLTKPMTVLFVKDRKYGNVPQRCLEESEAENMVR